MSLKMSWLLLFFLMLKAVGATDGDSEGSADYGDDEDEALPRQFAPETRNEIFVNVGNSKGQQDDQKEDGSVLIIIIAGVAVVALVAAVIGAVVLFRRHANKRDHGVYTVPTEQGQSSLAKAEQA